MTGLSREAVVKGLRSLRALGWIDLQARELTVLDDDAMRQRGLDLSPSKGPVGTSTHCRLCTGPLRSCPSVPACWNQQGSVMAQGGNHGNEALCSAHPAR